MTTTLVSQSGTFDLGGDRRIHRLGYGAMQLTGEGVWGPPADPRRRSRCCDAPSNRA
jgi:pyridoxine 4-dehydrogenase